MSITSYIDVYKADDITSSEKLVKQTES